MTRCPQCVAMTTHGRRCRRLSSCRKYPGTNRCSTHDQFSPGRDSPNYYEDDDRYGRYGRYRERRRYEGKEGSEGRVGARVLACFSMMNERATLAVMSWPDSFPVLTQGSHTYTAHAFLSSDGAGDLTFYPIHGFANIKGQMPPVYDRASPDDPWITYIGHELNSRGYVTHEEFLQKFDQWANVRISAQLGIGAWKHPGMSVLHQLALSYMLVQNTSGTFQFIFDPLICINPNSLASKTHILDPRNDASEVNKVVAAYNAPITSPRQVI